MVQSVLKIPARRNGHAGRNGVSPPHVAPKLAVPETPPTEPAAFYEWLFRKYADRVTGKLELITVPVAKAMLARFVKNRPQSNAVIRRIASKFEALQWQVNGEALVIDEGGDTLNGWHRLTAVVETRIPVPIFVVRGVPTSAFTTFDQGKGRSTADTLAIVGENECAVLQAAIGWWHRYQRNAMNAGSRNYLAPTPDDALAILAANPGLRESAKLARAAANAQPGVIFPGPWAFLHHACAAKHPDHLGFFEQIYAGAVAPDTPQHVLYRRLVENLGSRAKLSGVTILAFAAKAWNAHVTGTPMRRVLMREGESFPEIL